MSTRRGALTPSPGRASQYIHMWLLGKCQPTRFPCDVLLGLTFENLGQQRTHVVLDNVAAERDDRSFHAIGENGIIREQKSWEFVHIASSGVRHTSNNDLPL
jgi:hypothetical protein